MAVFREYGTEEYMTLVRHPGLTFEMESSVQTSVGPRTIVIGTEPKNDAGFAAIASWLADASLNDGIALDIFQGVSSRMIDPAEVAKIRAGEYTDGSAGNIPTKDDTICVNVSPVRDAETGHMYFSDLDTLADVEALHTLLATPSFVIEFLDKVTNSFAKTGLNTDLRDAAFYLVHARLYGNDAEALSKDIINLATDAPTTAPVLAARFRALPQDAQDALYRPNETLVVAEYADTESKQQS